LIKSLIKAKANNHANTIIIRGKNRLIIFKELSLVAVPADSRATFSIAMKEAYNTSKSQQVQTIPIATESVVIANSEVKEEIEIKEEVKTEVKEESQLVNPENAEESVKDVQGLELNELKGGINEMSENTTEAVDATKILQEKLEAMEKANKELTEKITALSAPKVEEKTILVNEFDESDADVKEGYKIVQGLGYFSFVADKY
jgi:hypothetical protein